MLNVALNMNSESLTWILYSNDSAAWCCWVMQRNAFSIEYSKIPLILFSSKNNFQMIATYVGAYYTFMKSHSLVVYSDRRTIASDITYTVMQDTKVQTPYNTCIYILFTYIYVAHPCNRP
jgi:hypothetical protein